MSVVRAEGLSFGATLPYPPSSVREIKTCELCGGLFLRHGDQPTLRICADCTENQIKASKRAVQNLAEIAQLVSEAARFKPYGVRGGQHSVTSKREKAAQAAPIAHIDYFGG